MHKTFREFNGKTYMLDEFSYFGINKSDAEKRKAIYVEKEWAPCQMRKEGKWQIRSLPRISW